MSRLRSHFLSPVTYIGLSILAFAFLIRLYCLDCKGLWYDEVASLEVARRALPDLLTDRFGWMLVQTPLHYLIVWITSWPVDPAVSPVFVRLPSAVGGALTTLAVLGVGRELFGSVRGLVAAVALAFSAVHIGYAQDLRPYSLVVLFTVLAIYCLLVAERTGERRWWVAFVLAAVANLYLSYFALTLVLPALIPYLVWIIIRLRTERGIRFLLLALAATVVAAIPLVVDLASVPRNAPDIGLLTPSLLLTQYTTALTQLTKIGVGGNFEVVIQWLFIVFAILGLLTGVRDKKWSGVIICGSFVLLPSLLMAIFRTSNSVFQRYILFTLPFYLLLVANGAFGLWGLMARPARDKRIATIGTYAIGLLVVIPFAYSTWVYFDPAQYRVFGSQPDYRSVSRYLREVARPEDLIVVADEPALGATVLGYYWGGESPAPFFDARDPRLPSESKGFVFLVVSFFQNDAAFLARLSAASNNWIESKSFERVVVLKSPYQNTATALEHLVSLLEAENASFQPVLTLRGSISQGDNEPEAASLAYRAAGKYFGTGDEYLRTANGYFERGDVGRAWREALISKFMQPANPAIHQWFAARLFEEGNVDRSNVEQELARLLAAK